MCNYTITLKKKYLQTHVYKEILLSRVAHSCHVGHDDRKVGSEAHGDEQPEEAQSGHEESLRHTLTLAHDEAAVMIKTMLIKFRYPFSSREEEPWM
jgi:hypothetical protein